MRAAWLMAAALLAGGCSRERQAEAPPTIVAIKAGGADLARLRARAAECGAAHPRLQTIDNATVLVLDRTNSVAARDCFFAAAHADYRAHHPVRAWIEGLIG